MSVIMTLRIPGDPEAMERYAKDHPGKLDAVGAAAKRHGAIAHRMYGSEDGKALMVLDEWPDRESFEAFFQEQDAEIRPMMEAVGASAAPETAFWHELATDDAFGWGA